MKTGRVVIVLLSLAVGLVLWTPSAGWSQQLDIEARPPTPQFEIVPPALYDVITRPTDADFYVEPPLVQYDPAFIEPFATVTETGRAGLSGWTAPRLTGTPAVLSGRHELAGWLAIGFSVTWGGPPVGKAGSPR